MAGQAETQSGSRLMDVAFLLPLLGFLAFSPIAFYIIGIDARIGNLPILPIYLFSVWFVLIFAIRLISRNLMARQDLLEATEEEKRGDVKKEQMRSPNA